VTLRAVAVIPAFDEARSIGAVVAGVRPFVEDVIVIDDGSRDGTMEAAKAAGAMVIRHEHNQGKGCAVRSGIAHALASTTWTHLLTIDGDLQHLPHEVPILLKTAEETGADLVLGERTFGRADMPAARYHANRIGSRALSSFLGTQVADTQCGFRVFRSGIIRRLTLRATGYEIETEMLVKVRRHGGRIVSAPVTAVYGGSASKLRPVRDTTRTCFLAVYYRFLEPL
jgi:UDP-N-acetylglucosamine---dolichyl-phosphate N-acetylglucosaminyltransferase